MKIKYKNHKFKAKQLERIELVNSIIDEYAAQGFKLTLRQVFYQLVSKAYIPNSQKEYANLGSLINDARLAGLIDWTAIEDRTRFLRSQAHWDRPSDIIEACADQFKIDRWANQSCYCNVWIEKDALVGVLEKVCNELDVPYFSCRGYVSQSEMWEASERYRKNIREGKQCYLFHLGDHDPSGIDMTRDIEERLLMFGAEVEVQRLALNMDQVESYDPPPNSAKMTDSRFGGYITKFGSKSWELDALEPKVIVGLVRKAVEDIIDQDKWDEMEDQETKYQQRLEDLTAEEKYREEKK